MQINMCSLSCGSAAKHVSSFWHTSIWRDHLIIHHQQVNRSESCSFSTFLRSILHHGLGVDSSVSCWDGLQQQQEHETKILADSVGIGIYWIYWLYLSNVGEIMGWLSNWRWGELQIDICDMSIPKVISKSLSGWFLQQVVSWKPRLPKSISFCR